MVKLSIDDFEKLFYLWGVKINSKDNLRVRKVQVKVKESLIEYDEFYLVDENEKEIFDWKIENDKRLYDIYKKKNKYPTNEEIKK